MAIAVIGTRNTAKDGPLRVRHIVEPRYFTVWLVSAISVLLRSNESLSRI